MTATRVTATDTTLFHVAALFLGDPTQWARIARLNGLTDPIIVGSVTLALPPATTQPNRPGA